MKKVLPYVNTEVRERIDNTKLLADSGLRIVHVRPHEGRHFSGMTVAYHTTDIPRPKVVRISAAYCRKGDTFCKKNGTKLAIESYQRGCSIYIPTGGLSPVDAIKRTFGEEL